MGGYLLKHGQVNSGHATEESGNPCPSSRRSGATFRCPKYHFTQPPSPTAQSPLPMCIYYFPAHQHSTMAIPSHLLVLNSSPAFTTKQKEQEGSTDPRNKRGTVYFQRKCLRFAQVYQTITKQEDPSPALPAGACLHRLF